MLHFSPAERNVIAHEIGQIARSAGDVLARMHGKALASERKRDGSPVSEADRAAEAVVEMALQRAFPGMAIVSEENAASQRMPSPERFFIVDPLDGTRAFLRGAPDFCVLIALIENGVPVAAALDAPLRGLAYRAGERVWRRRLPDHLDDEIAPYPSMRAEIGVISVHHSAEASRQLCTRFGLKTVLAENSALKFARLAEGEADIYPRAGTTMQWDVAAGDAMLRALGGITLDLAGQPLVYGSQSGQWEVPGFVAWRRKP
jgi:3'(2'), 5'-bisphosphate nucleotidase